ncbi:MAG: DNA helicase [Alphaproteobacteria bacterium]|nr:MAG: DNA helicase [Alphaproteobacteria bacterium]
MNTEQANAVTTLNGPLLVLSGAGTGKTRVLTARLAQLVASRTAAPWNILAVTFTNKAAREMKERVTQLVGPMVEQVMLGTFHALAARMLRQHAELVGLKSDYTILDTDDQNRLLKQLMEAEQIDLKRWPPRVLAAQISAWKDKGLRPEKLSVSDAGDICNGKGIELYKQYQSRLVMLNAADFGDLLLHMLHVFQTYPDVLAHYQSRLTHIMVDEYQDTNVAQYLWLRLLASEHKNLCCVGDDDQSIYGWRGAEVGNILRFESDYPGAKTVRLEENYRSTGHILAAASSLISKNENRLGKTLYTSIDDGEKLLVSGYWDGQDEARHVASKIEGKLKDGFDLNQIAVLVRAGFQTREFEERFLSIGLPYRVVGTRFYERAEIRDAMAYLRLINQPADDLAFERIINTPKRGLGLATLQIIHRLARAREIPLLAAAGALAESDELKPQARRTLIAFCAQIAGWCKQKDTIVPAEFLQVVLDESGYTEMWQKDKAPDAPGRLENLKELVSAIEDFDTLGGFLEHISLVMDNETVSQEGEVTLMTLHAAKGLEFDMVFLPGWEDGIFPSQRTLDESGGAGLEEERRLAYVGLTRARRNVYISFAANRRIHGLWQSSIPSRFVGELPAAHIDEDMAQGLSLGSVEPVLVGALAERAGQPGYGPAWKRLATRLKGTSATPARDRDGWLPQSGKHDLKTGERVFHQKFGMGTIDAVEADKLEILFDKAGLKKVVASFVSRPDEID